MSRVVHATAAAMPLLDTELRTSRTAVWLTGIVTHLPFPEAPRVKVGLSPGILDAGYSTLS